MGRMKELAQAQQENQLRFPDMESAFDELPLLHSPTSFMEIQYEESLYKLMYNYHQLTNEEIETIKRIANRII